MSFYRKFIQITTLRRLFVLLTIIFILYLGQSMITMILLTFIFTFLALHFVEFVEKFIRLPFLALVLGLYTLIVFFIYLAVTKYVPIVIDQSIQTYNSVINFYQNPADSTNAFLTTIDNYLEKSNLLDQIKNSTGTIIRYVQDIGSFSLSILLSFILSFFYMIEKKRMAEFSKLFFKGHFHWFFEDCYYFANKFVNTFGVVIEAQFFIAFSNTCITILCLALIGFSQLPSLAIMVFLFSLIPVAGVIISCVPLMFIAYSEGGIQDVFYVLIIIIIVHLLEAYVLNPKFMSSKTELPIFYTFVVLLISERLFGIWGLIVGIPIFIFFLDILKIKPIHIIEKNNNTHS